MRRQRIDNASKGSKTTTEAEADQRQSQYISNNDRVIIFLAFRLLTVTLSYLYIVAV